MKVKKLGAKILKVTFPDGKTIFTDKNGKPLRSIGRISKP